MTQERLVDGRDEKVIDVDPGEYEDVSQYANDEDDQLGKIFESIEGADDNLTDYKITVMRQIPNTADLEHCFKCLPSEVSGLVDRLKDEFGPGAYQIRIYKNGRLFRRPTIRIAKGLSPTQIKGDGTTSAMLQEMLASQRQFQQDLLATRAQPGAGDPMSMMGAMVGMMVQMKEFLTPAQPQQSPFESFKLAMELLKDVRDDGGEKGFGDVMFKAMEHFAPTLKEATKALSQQEAPAITHTAVPASDLHATQETAIANQQAPQVTITHGEQSPMQQNPDPRATQIAQAVGLLITKAASGADPALYADLVLDNIDHDLAKQLTTHPNLIEYLSAFDSRVMQFAEWFILLRDEMAAALTEDEQNGISDPNNTGASVNADHKTANGDITSD